MTVDRIDQVIPSLASRDAIGGHALQLQSLLRSPVSVRHLLRHRHADRLDAGLPVSRLGDHSSSGRALLYQLSIGSGVADIFRERSERKFVNYHNITPADLLEAWMPAVGEEVRWGRSQLRDLAPITEFAIADSEFNEGELRSAGYRSTVTLPLLIDLDSFAGHPDPQLAARLADQKSGGGADLLFVGKVSPHKGQHDLIKGLARTGSSRSAGPAACGGGIDQRGVLDRHRAVRRRVGPFRRRRHRRCRLPRGVDRLLRGVGCLRLPLQSRGVLRPAAGVDVPRLPIVAFATTVVPETVRSAGLTLPDKHRLGWPRR